MLSTRNLSDLVSYSCLVYTLQADGSTAIELKAMGRAINKAVTIAEILKRKIPLHQQNTLSSVEMVDVYEPLEEGLDVVTSRRYVSCMMIVLSQSLEALDPSHTGYQPPLSERDVHASARGGGATTSQPLVYS